MSDTCPVVTIMTKNGPVEINESDFDQKTMKLATEADLKKADAPADKTAKTKPAE